MTWANFCEAVDFLSAKTMGLGRLPNGIHTRSMLLQSLEALGHCDAYYEEGQYTITAVPSSLCLLPKGGLPVAVLAGARYQNTIGQLRSAPQVSSGEIQIIIERHPGPLGLFPDTILIKSESEDAMADFSEYIGVPCPTLPPAWTLVNWCGAFAEYEATLDHQIPEELNWTRYDFSVKSQSFIRTPSKSLPRLSRYLNPTTSLPIHVLFNGDRGAEVDLSWGRYLFLKAKSINVAAYDKKRFRLCIPIKVPLPAVVAKSICLCSGKSPIYWSEEFLVQGLNCDDWLMFEDIPPQIALIALSKVGQTPIMVNIN